MGRRGSLTGIAVAIGVALAYFVIMLVWRAGRRELSAAALAAWSSDLIFGLVGGYCC